MHYNIETLFCFFENVLYTLIFNCLNDLRLAAVSCLARLSIISGLKISGLDP